MAPRLRQRLAFDDVTVAKDEAPAKAKRSDVKAWKFQGNELHPCMVDLLGSQLLHCGETGKKKGEKKLGSPGLQSKENPVFEFLASSKGCCCWKSATFGQASADGRSGDCIAR